MWVAVKRCGTRRSYSRMRWTLHQLGSSFYCLPGLQKCNGLHIAKVPAAWLTTWWVVWESGAASRLFTAAVKTECTTLCVRARAVFLLCTISCSLSLYSCRVSACESAACSSRLWIHVNLFVCQCVPLSLCLLPCECLCSHVCFYSCVYTPVCVSGTI